MYLPVAFGTTNSVLWMEVDSIGSFIRSVRSVPLYS